MTRQAQSEEEATCRVVEVEAQGAATQFLSSCQEVNWSPYMQGLSGLHAEVVNPEPLQPAATAGSSGCNLFSEIPLELLIYSALPG